MKIIRMIDESDAMQMAVAECNCKYPECLDAMEESVATGTVNRPAWDGLRPYGRVRLSEFIRVFQMTPIDPWRVKIDPDFQQPGSAVFAGMDTVIYEENVLNPFPAEICRRVEKEISAYLAGIRDKHAHMGLPPINGMKRDKVAEWVKLSYKMGINPLPALRKRYQELEWDRTLKYESGVLYITG